ncbi:MAG: DUF3164 family protein [Sphingobacteriales bacterium]|jgi:hypothetical protein|nr:DUF3164 family protein [Sphingobacteriales bacterium]MBP9141694.1 DUF3164 family protein [Chitinophagales bacterium]MDA0198489.1 DUF3164 family protein [Bacteroidota bacterium]MBK7528902.1 DUF3164 family protein [Sphingobacteriales bacterium]MBK8679108.1 DUF3164 family protein [Sphingobacteriales bacterium]
MIKLTPTKKLWVNERGHTIPDNKITRAEKVAERNVSKAIEKAEKLQQQMVQFKRWLEQACTDVYNAWLEQHKIKKGQDFKQPKGNYTLYNYNRAFKIQFSLNDLAVFDSIALETAKAMLMEMLDENIKSDAEFIIDIVKDAFSTSKGNLDVKKIQSLYRYENKVKDPRYKTAMQILREGTSYPQSTEYFRLFKRNDKGKYEPIVLQFSAL